MGQALCRSVFVAVIYDCYDHCTPPLNSVAMQACVHRAACVFPRKLGLCMLTLHTQECMLSI